MLWRSSLTLLLFVAALTLGGQPAPPPWVAELPAYEQFVSDWMRENHVPGLTIGFTKGSYTWVKAFGVADLENMTPMRIDSSYRLASVQKSMTAVAVLQLAEQGKLDLDAEIQRYVPYFPRKPFPVTARQLLAHLGGLPHYVNRDIEQHIKVHKTTREAVELFAGFDLVAEPGTKYSYSSYGYNLLGAAIEGASGLSYADYMTAHVWRPAGMLDTRLDDPLELIPHRVRGYRRDEAGQMKNSEFIDVSSRFAAGGTRSTVVDLLHFMRAFNDDVLLSPRSRAMMFTPARTRAGEELRYSLGWQLPPYETHGPLLGNDGGQQETRTNILMDPENQFAIAFAMNLEADIYGPVIERLWQLVEGKALVRKK
jgi:CubicO group peptidase (beta-lactamase class C family)